MASDGLSRRAQHLLGAAPLPEYLEEHFRRSEEVRDPNDYLPLCVAENRLSNDLLMARIDAVRGVPERVLGYDSMAGSLGFRETLSSFLGHHVFGRRPEPRQLAVLNGAGTVLEMLFHLLADPGEAVLVPTPSYAGFWLDLETRNELSIRPVETSSDETFRLTAADLEHTLEASERKVRAVLLTSPGNPLGNVLSPGELAEIASFCRSRELHLVVDEIYALSVFGRTPFTSIAEVLPELGSFVHVIWAFSKDFGASGLRCGLLWSENEALLRGVDLLAYWGCCSGHTQFLLGEIVADEPWVASYLETNRHRLGEIYRRVTSALGEAGLHFLPAEAGFFLLLDLRASLDEATWPAEHRLWRRILEETGVGLTPGSACRAPEPGYFRLCFAATAPRSTLLAIERLGRFLGVRPTRD